jgi:hypothetical protein
MQTLATLVDHTLRNMPTNRTDVTELLGQVNRGEADAFGLLVSAVYSELRRMAASLMRGHAGNHTLQPTALVHEAWMNLRC